MEPKHRFTSAHPAGCEPAITCSTWAQPHWNHVVENYRIRELIPPAEKLFQATVTDLLVPEGSVCFRWEFGSPINTMPWETSPPKTLLTEATVICVLYHPVSREVLRAVSQCLSPGRRCWAQCSASHPVLASLPSVPSVPLPPCSSPRLPRRSWVEKEKRSKES